MSGFLLYHWPHGQRVSCLACDSANCGPLEQLEIDHYVHLDFGGPSILPGRAEPPLRGSPDCFFVQAVAIGPALLKCSAVRRSRRQLMTAQRSITTSNTRIS